MDQPSWLFPQPLVTAGTTEQPLEQGEMFPPALPCKASGERPVQPHMSQSPCSRAAQPSCRAAAGPAGMGASLIIDHGTAASPRCRCHRNRPSTALAGLPRLCQIPQVNAPCLHRASTGIIPGLYTGSKVNQHELHDSVQPSLRGKNSRLVC